MRVVAYAEAEKNRGHNCRAERNGRHHVYLSDTGALARAFRPSTKPVYEESSANSILRLTDIASVAEICRAKRVRLAVDSTFASPVAPKALAPGDDFEIHSLTKYIEGHRDAIGGVVISDRKFISELRQGLGFHSGVIQGPFTAWIIMQGLATRASRSALRGNVR